MFLNQILASTIHGKNTNSQIKNLKYQLPHGMKDL